MATIKDVANLAGVSVATVSRMMNNRGVVSDKTRRKVMRAMKELSYRPNEMARALQTRKSHIVGLLVPAIDNPFFCRLISSVEQACCALGYKLMLCRSGYQESREKELVELLQANKVDGILLCSYAGDTAGYSRLELPVVSIDRIIEGIPSVVSDNQKGGMLAAQALYEAGSRRPLLCSGIVAPHTELYRRNISFVQECRRRGMLCANVEVGNDLQEPETVRTLQKAFREAPDIDGVFVNSDLMAAQFLQLSRGADLKAARNLPLVGYDGIGVSKLLGISTIVQPIESVGECAVNLLVQIIDGKSVPEKSLLSVTYVARESTCHIPG